MVALILRRIIAAIPMFIVVSFIMYMLLILAGNPLEMLKQDPKFRPEDIARISKMYGWDKPWYQQYLGWLTGFIRGDMGTSIATGGPALDLIKQRLPLTLMLTGTSMIVSMTIAIPIGAYVAIRKYSKADYLATVLTFAMMATPSFFLALLLQLFALKLQDMAGGSLVFNTAGAPDCVASGALSCLGTPIELIKRLALPVTALSMLQIAGWSRYQRSELLNVLNSDYIKCATAKGMPSRHVFIRHAMRNTMLPMITIVALDVALLFSGAVITERVFGLPGMGNLLFDSVINRDTMVALAIVMIGTFLVLFFNTVADILYGVFDPRVRVS